VLVEHRGYSPLTGLDSESGKLELKAGDKIKDLVLRLTPDAVISGRVLDANGVPAENASVGAISAGTAQFVSTNDRGEFRIGGLHQGRYLIKALGYQPPLPPEIRTDGSAEINYGLTYYPSTALVKSAVPVQARAGQETGGIDVKLVPLPLLHVSGTVLNLPDDFRQNLSVLLQQHGKPTHGARVRSDMKFTLWRVPPGHYQLFAESFFKGKMLFSAPVEITITNTSVEGLSLALSPPFELTGHVEMEGGGSLDGLKGRASIKLQPVGGMEHMERDENIAPDGSFKMEELYPGRYYVMGEDLPENLYVKSARVGMAEAHGGILDIPAGSAKGTLEIEIGTNGANVSGIVRDAKGPVSGIGVAMFFDNDAGTDIIDRATTGADGSYKFQGVPPGKYKLLTWDIRSSPNELWTVRWTPDALALYSNVMESIEVSEGDKISQDLKILTFP